MTLEELKIKIANEIGGQGNQVDISGALPEVLYTIIEELEAIKHTHALLIRSEANASAGGYQVPVLTAEQVTLAYNAVVSGRAAIIIDKDEVLHAYVNQADSLNGEISIGILFYSYLLLTYTLEDTGVIIQTKALGNG